MPTFLPPASIRHPSEPSVRRFASRPCMHSFPLPPLLARSHLSPPFFLLSSQPTISTPQRRLRGRGQVDRSLASLRVDTPEVLPSLISISRSGFPGRGRLV